MKLREIAAAAIIAFSIWAFIVGYLEFGAKKPDLNQQQTEQILNDRSEGWPDGNKDNMPLGK
jgi:hypothetical protein